MPVRASRLLPVALATCLVAASMPAQAQESTDRSDPAHAAEQWQEGDPIPAGYTTTLRARKGFVLAGTLLLAIPYGVSFTGAVGNELVRGPSRENWLFLPGAGPVVLMAQTGNPPGNIVLALDGLAQLAGIAMIAYGVASPGPVLLRESTRASFLVTPMLGGGRSGAAIVGRF